MAQSEKKVFIAKMLEGREREGAAERVALPSNRWSLFWDIFRGRISKLVIVNLLVLLFCIPMVVVFFLRYANINVQTMYMPFSGWVGTGYTPAPDLSGLQQQVIFSANVLYGALMLAAAIVAAVGIAGGIYVLRNMVWTEGVFVANDFWRGIKNNFVTVLQATVFYGALLYFLVVGVSWAQWQLALGEGAAALMIFITVLCYILMAIVTIMFLWMLTLGDGYKLGFFSLLKDSFLMTFGLFFRNVAFVAAMSIPVLLLFLGGFFQMIAVILMILLGISYMLFVWVNYSQWAFDKYCAPKKAPQGAARAAASKTEKGGAESKSAREYQEKLEEAMSVKSELAARPIKPITDDLAVYELPETFSRGDLKKLRESKELIEEDTQNFVDEHKGDERYVLYNAKFERKEESAAPAKKSKKKKGSPKQSTEGNGRQ